MGKKSRSGSQKSTPVGTPTKENYNGKAGGKSSPKTSSVKGSPKSSPKTSKAVSKEQSFRNRIVHALNQLKQYEEKKNQDGDEKDLLGGDEELGKYVQLIAVNNTSFTGNKKDFKPKLLNIKHSLFEAWKKSSVTMVKDFKILLILRDSDANEIESEQVLEGLQDAPPLEIIAAKELKTTYKAYEARRAFLSEFSLILADDNVVTSLPKLLGVKAYGKLSTTPVPIKTHSNGQLSLQTVRNKLQKIYQSKLPVVFPRGTTMNVHLGHFDWLSTEELAENVESIVEQLKEKHSLRSVFVKSADSPAVPLYYNQDVIDEISKGKDELANAKNAAEYEEVEVGGVKVSLSQFDSALAEVANPEELKSIFRHKLKRSKPEKEQKDDQGKKEEKHSSQPKTKKAKA